MHGDAAVALLRAMGHSGTVPGAILAADLPEALASLRQRRSRTQADGPSPVPRRAARGEEDEDEDAPAARDAAPCGPCR